MRRGLVMSGWVVWDRLDVGFGIIFRKLGWIAYCGGFSLAVMSCIYEP